MKRTKLMLLTTVAGLAFGVSAAQAQIDIATAGPMTGQYAAFGEQMQRGAEMAVEDINAAGGVLGEELVLHVGDDACDPRQAVSVANQFVNDGVAFVAGHFCSGSSIPASQVYNEEGILQISPASTAVAFTEQGFDNVFRVIGRDDVQGVVAAQYIQQTYPDAKIAILHDRTPYGQGLADATKAELNNLGVTEAMYEAYTAGESDYSALVSRLKDEDVDVVYVGGYHTEAGLILRQMREQGMDAQMISGDALQTEEFWSITGDAGEGMIYTFAPVDEARQAPAAAEVVAKFEAQGFNPEGYTLYTYAAIQVFAQAAEIAGSTELEGLIEALHNNTFDTVVGQIAFDEKGDIVNPRYVWYEWGGGTYAPMETAAQ